VTDTFEIGPVPCEEKCEQLGPNYDPNRAKAECRIFISLLKRTFGEPPDGARYVVTSNRHDFGTYYEVGIKADDNSAAAMEYAFKVEGNAPARWDEIARADLDAIGTPFARLSVRG
jgi:hypothetical protein